VTAVLTAALGAAAVTAVDSTAATPSCTAKVTVTGPVHGNLVLTPATVKVAVGGCVRFTNATGGTLSLTVSQGDKTVFTATMAKGAVVDGKNGFAPTAAGTDTIAASEKALLNLGTYTGSGSITVKPAPSSTPSHSPSPTPSHHSNSPTAKPHHSPTPKHSKKSTPGPHATGIKLPKLPPLPSGGLTTVPLPKGSIPVVAPGPSTAPPVVASSATPVAAIYNGPVERAVDNSRGLPIAVGVLVVLGLASGWGRVLLAAPVSAGGRTTNKRQTGSRQKRKKGSVDKRPKGSVDKRPKGDHRN
jgi:plastocyanin